MPPPAKRIPKRGFWLARANWRPSCRPERRAPKSSVAFRRKPTASFAKPAFIRVLQPAAFGGLELSYGFHTQLAEEIARGCPSSAWVLGVIACHSWIFGMFPPEAQREFWSADPSATLATSFFPDGATVKREGDGFRLKGRWKFSSGVDHCQGIILMAFMRPESAPANASAAGRRPDPVFSFRAAPPTTRSKTPGIPPD